MIKRITTMVLCLCILISNIPSLVFADETTDTTPVDMTNSVGELGGYLSANTKMSNQFYTERRFTGQYGYGFAAERGNNLIDALKGHRTSVVGDNNMKNGPDRMIINRNGTITWIQQGKKYIYVDFINKGKKMFVYPDVFMQGFLSIK